MNNNENGKFIEGGLSCPFEDCGSSDAVSVYEKPNGQIDGTCYSCRRYIRYPYGTDEEKPKVMRAYNTPAPQLKAISLEDGLTHPTRQLEDRGLSHVTASYFGVKVGVSSKDGETPIYTLFPRHREGEQVGWKLKDKDKNIRSSGGNEIDLFGSHLCKPNGKKIWITEGEEDAMSVYQALKEDSTLKWEPAVVSLPDGCTSAAKSISRSLELLNGYNEVILVFDNDQHGKEAVKVACKILAGKVSVVTLPLKDANEMIKAHRTLDLKWLCLSHAKKYQPDGIVNAKDLWDRYKDNSEVSCIPYPPAMQELNNHTYGVRPGSIVTITAGSGSGKTQFMRELMYHYATQTKYKMSAMFLEEDLGETLSGLISLDVNKRITLPDVEISEEDERESFERVFGHGRISLYDYFGGMDDDSLLGKLKYFAVTGSNIIFLDHFSLIVSEYAAEGGERERIDTLMTKLAKFVKEFNIVLFLVVHLRKTSVNGVSFEQGARPSLDDLRGSGTLKQLSWDVIGLSRNQQHDNPRTANVTEVSVLKCRFTGRTGTAGYLEFNDTTGRMNLTEKPSDFDETKGKVSLSNKYNGEY